MNLEQEYTQLLYALLPPGPAWGGENNLLEGLAPSLAATHQRGLDLLREVDPARTEELIERYEALCGLPDDCTIDEAQTLSQRQQRLDAKVSIPGGINATFYRQQLDALGYYDVTIEQFQHLNSSPNPEWGDRWRYYWRVSIPADAQFRWMTCSSECNAELRTWGDTVVECIINKLSPSHTVVVFSYSEGNAHASN
ncbi:phage tail protein [Enterobacterales bacterium CwR94]|nr:phage tail protein [Enterobacterales bacterium CwR94]